MHYAMEDLAQNPPEADAVSEIDQDWLNTFSSHAAKRSQHDMQVLWGKVLAGEIRKPGSFKLRTLAALSILEQPEASLIHRAAQFTIDRDKIYLGAEKQLLSLDELLELASLDVIVEPNGLDLHAAAGPGRLGE